MLLSILGPRERLSGVNNRDNTIQESAMKYLCLVYVEEKKLNALSKGESEALIEESLAYDDELRKSGHYIVSNALQPVRLAVTVRSRDGKTFVTDGPFAETKEQLGGFVLIEASDLNDAIQVAAKIPPGRFGCIEVRPIQELDMTKEHIRRKLQPFHYD
jgi:hypothetical protein